MQMYANERKMKGHECTLEGYERNIKGNEHKLKDSEPNRLGKTIFCLLSIFFTYIYFFIF